MATDIPNIPKPYRAPLWLLGAPASPDVPWVWEVPSLERPVSQLCTGDQMTGSLFDHLCASVHLHPNKHRKVWEFIYIFAALSQRAILRPGARMLGFGVGGEPLPSVFAARGAHVTATDAPEAIVAADGWQTTGQHASALEQLHRPDIVAKDVFDRLVRFQQVDMNAIPDDLRDFDACWSACALEHLGGIDQGLAFIENSLATLKVGGVAVHTTEFNLSSNDVTFEEGNLAIFRRQDIERLIAGLTRAGHKVAPLNLHPGSSAVDEHIDLPPFALPHLKLKIADYVATSFGIIVERGG